MAFFVLYITSITEKITSYSHMCNYCMAQKFDRNSQNKILMNDASIKFDKQNFDEFSVVFI